VDSRFHIVYLRYFWACCWLPKYKVVKCFIIENYARSLGMNYKKSRQFIILLPAFGGKHYRFAGPINFIGLAVPHIAA
jgi:ABC-type Fe3+-siderophore transport system permease subunit